MKKKNNLTTSSEDKLSSKLLLCVIPIIMIIGIRIFKLNNEADTKIIIRLIFAAITAFTFYMSRKGKLTVENVITLLIISGIILRGGYTAYTHAFTRGQDIGANNSTGVGHWGYLYHIMQGELPPSNEYQFYQPPLFYIVSSVFIRIGMFITRNHTWSDFLYLSQSVSCIASCITLVITAETIKKLKASPTTIIIFVSLTAFYPANILAAGRMNNDSLVLMFMMLSLYFTLMWHEKQMLKYIIGIAVSIGCAMMTKINGAMVAFIIGPIMIYHLVLRIRTKDSKQIKDIILQLAVFAIICFPLGLWYPIRNLIRFDQPLNFVHDLGKNSVLYTGDDSFAERWILIPFNKFVSAPYMTMNKDTSIIMTLIKTGVHGEFSYDGLSSLIAWGLDYIHTALILLAGIAIAFMMIADRELSLKQKLIPFLLWLLFAVSYIQFNIAYPYICTADFRYVFPAQIAAAYFIGCFITYCNVHSTENFYRITSRISTSVVFLFCIMSIMHFC